MRHVAAVPEAAPKTTLARKKPKEPTVSFEIPPIAGLAAIALDRDGSVMFLDSDGNALSVPGVTRTVAHARTKGPKVRTQQRMNGAKLSLDGLGELAAFHDVFVVDTTYTRWPLSRPRAVACAVRVIFHPEHKHVRVAVDGRMIVYELLDYVGNPERAALLALTTDHSSTLADRCLRRAVVNDSDLGEHEAINRREVTLYGQQVMPAPFTLAYASADVGAEVLNRLVQFCDAQAKLAYRALLSGEAAAPSHYERLPGAGDLRVRRLHVSGIEAENNLLSRVQGFPETASVNVHAVDGWTETIPFRWPDGQET